MIWERHKEVATPDSIPGYKGSFVVPVNLEYNVKVLHKFLFPNETYKPSETVASISDEIAYLTDIYVDEEEFDGDTKQDETQESIENEVENTEDLGTGE